MDMKHCLRSGGEKRREGGIKSGADNGTSMVAEDAVVGKGPHQPKVVFLRIQVLGGGDIRKGGGGRGL